MVAELEDTADGCDWLLQRWSEYGNLLQRRTRWEEPVLIRFLRLMGKRLVEAVFDPEINLIFLAWDVIEPGYARKEWESYRDERSILDPAYTHRLKWREIAPRPKDPEEAWEVLSTIFNEYITRLKELLAENEANEAMLKDDPTWMDRAAMDCSPAFERHRRYQSARTRELHKTLELLNKMRNAEWQMAEGETGVASGRLPVPVASEEEPAEVASGQWSVASEEKQTGVASGQLPVASEEEPAEGAVEVVEMVAEGKVTPENAPKEAKSVSTQIVESQIVEPESRSLAGRERSQNASAERELREASTPAGSTRDSGFGGGRGP